MLRGDVTDGAEAAGAFARGLATLGLFGATGACATGTAAFFGGSAGFFDAALTGFFEGFPGDFLAAFLVAFLAADFFAAFFAVFFTVFLAAFFVLPAFFATRLFLVARFFDAAFLVARAGEDLRAFLALCFFGCFS